MAFTYNDNLNADRDLVRIKIADPQLGGGIFTDDELDGFLCAGGSVEEAVKIAIRALMMHHAVRGDVARVSALKLALDAYGGNAIPTVSVDFTGNLPMDSGYVEGS